MAGLDLHIPFLFPNPLIEDRAGSEDEFENIVSERRQFWIQESTREWFNAQGYVLYKPEGGQWTWTDRPLPQLPNPDFVEAEYPFPFHSSYAPPAGNPRQSEDHPSGAACYAQDMLGRHVLIKMVAANSDELQIYEILHQSGLDVVRENCLVPVLGIIYLKQVSLIVMPRWGGNAFLPRPQTLQEAIDFMEATLKGLAFLHRNRIAHRDMATDNILVNHFSCAWCDSRSTERAGLRKAGRLAYAVMDFDLSIVVSEGEDPSHFRLLYRFAYDGKYPQPLDVDQGEYDYDPFAYDVGTLGANLARTYQHLCCDLPFLAPLFDMMTTREVSKRFSAQRSLEFFHECLRDVPQVKLLKTCPSKNWSDPFDHPTRWQHVPSDLVQRWAAYREPPLPRLVKVARWICSFRCLVGLVRTLRRLIAGIVCLIFRRQRRTTGTRL
ncbi:other/AgaK1 protein kinase [Coprinopsis sp. MPI-PUGE-AT-0042]|nr:other/AgaK1 protein kinase [Coprinopsis sp. MPI-PUGE-AT-0042]